MISYQFLIRTFSEVELINFHIFNKKTENVTNNIHFYSIPSNALTFIISSFFSYSSEG